MKILKEGLSPKRQLQNMDSLVNFQMQILVLVYLVKVLPFSVGFLIYSYDLFHR